MSTHASVHGIHGAEATHDIMHHACASLSIATWSGDRLLWYIVHCISAYAVAYVYWLWAAVYVAYALTLRDHCQVVRHVWTKYVTHTLT